MNKEQAQIALDQLSKQLAPMIGAYSFMIDSKGVSFRFKAKSKYNCCKLTLNSMDLYDMNLMKIRAGNIVREETKEGLYNDMLTESFEQATGLLLSL